MYHSITFGDKNTWDDWHLIPSSRPIFQPPEVKTNYIEVPGANGVLDYTEALTGYPTYNNRTGEIEFIVANGYWDWDVAYSTIMNYLHGRRMKAVLEDDKAFYYEGRFSVNQWTSYKGWSTITINYDVYPYKRSIQSSIEDWLWDPFDFETGIINNFKNLAVNGSLYITIHGLGEPVTPIFTASSDMSVQNVNTGKEWYIRSGTPISFPDLIVTKGALELRFIGRGSVSIDYRGGSL